MRKMRKGATGTSSLRAAHWDVPGCAATLRKRRTPTRPCMCRQEVNGASLEHREDNGYAEENAANSGVHLNGPEEGTTVYGVSSNPPLVMLPEVEENVSRATPPTPVPGSDKMDLSSSQKVVAPGVGDLMRFTLPTMAIWLAAPILSLVDAAIVGSQSVVQLAALTPGTVIVDYFTYVFSFLGIAATNLLATSMAEKDRNSYRKTHGVLNDGLALGLACGIFLGAAIFCSSSSIFSTMIGEKGRELVAPATSYASIRAVGIPFCLVGLVLQCAFLASKDTTTPLLSTGIAGFTNLVLDLLFVRGMSLGIVGAAWATVTAQVVAVAVLVIKARGKKFVDKEKAAAEEELLLQQGGLDGHGGTSADNEGFSFELRVPSIDSLKKYLRISGPVSAILLSKVVVFSTVSMSAANLGPIGSAAHALVFGIFLFFCVPGDALNQCAQTFLPPCMGHPAEQNKLKRRLVLTGACIGVGNFILTSTIFMLGSGIITPNASVAAAIKQVGLLASFTMFIHPLGIATEGILMASHQFLYLLVTYGGVCASTCGVVAMLHCYGGPSLTKVWVAMVAMQLLRLTANSFKTVFTAMPYNAAQRSAAIAD